MNVVNIKRKKIGLNLHQKREICNYRNKTNDKTMCENCFIYLLISDIFLCLALFVRHHLETILEKRVNKYNLFDIRPLPVN
ncbi:hypothetical protein BpHYR1_016451 [Brachionus plicatilis]|uniref:Uncharacterized protein n=1 Tax=Brachionus plicatilis TaxID=10195 RepID=A0A3M7PPF5_BRAPC|nr:hypothetical protein BpHYR1_016451 [Brachionus plicatilis]